MNRDRDDTVISVVRGGRNGGPQNGILNVINHPAVARRFFPRLLHLMPVIPNEQSLSVRRICEMRDLPEQAET